MKIMRTEEHIGEKIRTRAGKKVASVALAALMIPGLFSVVWAEDTDPAVLYTAVAASEKSSDTVRKEISQLSIREFRGGAAKKKEIVLKWKRNTEADAYSIQRYSKRTGLYREIAVLTAKSGTSTCRYVDRGVKKGHYYCYRIRIRKDVDGNALYGQTSRSIGVYLAPDGSKKNNVSRLTTKKKSYRLVTGATVKPVVTLKTGRAGQKPHKMTKKWYSSDESIAAVSAKGRIRAKDQGECYIYCIAHNGKRAKIHVMVGMDPKQKIKTVPILTFHRIVPDKIKKRYYADN
ncbi:Ig-like domain-containing protein, partial [Hornefia butyriciproducens]